MLCGIGVNKILYKEVIKVIKSNPILEFVIQYCLTDNSLVVTNTNIQ